MNEAATAAIRRANPGDSVALATLARDTFVETFGHLYAPADLAAFLAKSQSVASYGPLLRNPGVAVWVAERADHELVGFLTAGPCKLPVPKGDASAGEIRQLYLRSSVQGGGLGTRLLVTGLEWLSSRGHQPLYVGVWSGNSGAQRLYARFGFEKVGEYDFPVGEHLDREYILRRRTTPPPGPGGS